MGRVAQVDPDQLAALRRLRAVFGDVEILAILKDPDQEQAGPQAGLLDQTSDEDGPGLET